MPRTKAKAQTTEQTASPESLSIPAVEASAAPAVTASPQLPEVSGNGNSEETAKLPPIPDPRSLMSVTLGPSNDSPKIDLLRSYRFRQMQIRSDEPLSEKHQGMLKEAGWTDRTEEEGIWTKQIPKDSGWQPAADAERLFKQIANEIRADKKLGPVLSM